MKTISSGVQWPCLASKTMIFLVLFTLFTSSLTGFGQRISSTSDSLDRAAEVSGVKFTVPKGFRLEQSANGALAFMRHEKDDLALFLAMPKSQQVSDAYLSDLSSRIVSQLLPREEGFVWKIWRHPDPKVSAFQSAGGTIKGLNSLTYVQTDFIAIRAQRREIVLGFVSVFGNANEAKHLFDVEGGEYSVPGWEGLFQLVASVTGESR